MLISSVESTDLFTGPPERPLQIVRVRLANRGPAVLTGGPAVTVTVRSRDVRTPRPAVVRAPSPAGETTAEVAVDLPAATPPGTSLAVLAAASWPGGTAELAADITVAEPGWTMWMVSHFHYDPVWWSTQGQFTEARLVLPDDAGVLPETRGAFELVRLHLDAARRDADYKFVLAELDYLKPYFDTHPQDRADLLELIKAGRIELVGGSYNEPNTNLTCVESTIRNAVYGIGYQRDVLGGNPRTAWMLDAFGFDPGYPAIMAAAGLTESAWARGPFHQWGPRASAGDNRLMQFASEFEWLSPDGTGLLTSYLANHYSAGWLAGHHAADLATAEAHAYEQFRQLAPVAATRNVLLPVGGDHTIPPRWAAPIHRDWNARYTWPRFVTAVPSEFFAAVRAEAAARDIWLTPQTRDMNPVYTGKDVTYIDTKQAQRAAETAVLDGERLATLAWLAGAPYPGASLDKAWRQLVYGAHHDAITGSEGDQVYLDLVAGWREAWERGDEARSHAIGHLAGLADTAGLAGGAQPDDPPTSADADHGAFAVVVVNSLSADRSAMATVELTLPPDWPAWLTLRDDAGAPVPFLADGVVRAADGALRAVRLTFRAFDVPGVGYRAYLVSPTGDTDGTDAGWRPAGQQPRLENEVFVVEADPDRGGTLSRVLDKRSATELLRAAGGGNELLLQPEHPAHPRWSEGPWLLCPAGPGTGTTTRRALVRAEASPVGSRLVATLELGGLQVTQETVLWHGADRVEFRTHVDGSIGQDHLLRVAFPANVPGGLPVYQTAVAVIGRPPGPIDTDVAEHPYTLDCPAAEWLALGSTAAVRVADRAAGSQLQAIGVAEVIAPPTLRGPVRDLVAALAARGVTATCSEPDSPRYGFAELDSNLPDFRICLGGPADNAQTGRVLAAAGPHAAAALTDQLGSHGAARLWLPAAHSRADAFGPGPDLRGPLDLPVLIVAAADLAAEITALAADLGDAVIEASALPTKAPATAGSAAGAGGASTALAGHTVGLLNRGTPSGLVTPEGQLTIALMRACSSWPCGVWIDGKRRTVPDGTSFAWQHWSHTFEYALAAGAGDWRTAGFPAAGQDYNHDLLTVATGLHPGPLPARARLASVEPDGAFLSALKPYGNPVHPAGQPDPAAGVTVRLREIAGGGPVAASVSLFTGLAAAALTSVSEDGRGAAVPVSGDAASVTVPTAGLATVVVTPAGPPAPRSGSAGPPLADTEPAQPVYARYWLHGKGPAPVGNVPVAVHLFPGTVALDDGPAVLRLTVACGPEPTAGAVRLEAPGEFALTPAGPLRYDLGPMGYERFELTVGARPGTKPGRWFLTAQIDGPAGQLIEDSALLAIGQPPPPDRDQAAPQQLARHEATETALAGELDVAIMSATVAVRPGGSGEIELLARNRTGSRIHGEAQLISPHGSWRRARPWTQGFALAAGAADTLRFELTAPATARRGEQWWALVKVMYFGRVLYTEPVEVTVR
ncbi:MAG TPA: glycoside hydrolase family 38 C-terminal domain-containing protein [Streptosporangiaceae bacterium]|nr:glycoside hydrolase family 38 C-terminal domain-containing protein [Streptosporangiaceae bacterium]